MFSEKRTDARPHRTDEPSEKKRSGFERVRRADTKKKDNRRFPVAMRLGETPVPIPNTMVKT